MCEIDFDERPKIWNVTRRQARVAHRCDCCRGPIRPGDAYVITAALFDSWTTEKACAACAEAIASFGKEHHGTPFPSAFAEFLDECIDGGDEGARWAPVREALSQRRAAAREVARG